MTLLDKNTKLTGAAAQSFSGTTTAGANTTDYYDWGGKANLTGPNELYVHGVCSVAQTAGGNTRFRLLGYYDGYPPGAIALVDLTAAAADNSLASATAHNLTAGQRITVAVAGTSGLSTSTDYYVLEVLSATKFTISTRVGGTAVTLVNSTADVDIDIEPVELGGITIETGRLVAGATFSFALAALPYPHPLPRYFVGNVLPAATTTGGTYTIWLSESVGAGGRVYHDIGNPMPAWKPA